MSNVVSVNRNPGLFTRERIIRFYEAIRYGSKIKAACQYAGISTSTYYDWKRRATQGQEPYATFQSGVQQAQGEFVVRNLQAVHAHTSIDWKAAAWLLERSYPEDYAQRQYIEEEAPLLKELKELISSGLITTGDLRKEMPDLPPEYFNALMALEATQMQDSPAAPKHVVSGPAVSEETHTPKVVIDAATKSNDSD